MNLTSRLRPPETEWSPGLSWVLEAAFAEKSPPAPSPQLEPSIVDLASRLRVSQRIAGRESGVGLSDDVRRSMRDELNRSAATCLLYESLARDIATVAAQHNVTLVFLKGFALYILEIQSPGSRPFGDLDIMVPADRAQSLHDALLERGFERIADQATEQHLGALRAPNGGVLEIHFALRGLRRKDGRPAAVDDLLRWHAVDRLQQFDGATYVPTRNLLAAHLLVHALQQHLLRPTTYPLFRVVGDLIDLLPDATAWETFETTWESRYSSSIDSADVNAVRDLCTHLAAGDVPAEDKHGSARLLSHLVAASLRLEYADSLASNYLMQRLRDAFRHGELGAYLRRKIARGAPPDSQGTSRWQRIERGLRRHLSSLVTKLRP